MRALLLLEVYVNALCTSLRPTLKTSVSSFFRDVGSRICFFIAGIVLYIRCYFCYICGVGALYHQGKRTNILIYLQINLYKKYNPTCTDGIKYLLIAMDVILPGINTRIRQLVDIYTNGSVKKFAGSINISQQTLNRLFNVDKRTGKYPTPTTDVLCGILEVYTEVDCRWLLTGKGEMFWGKEEYARHHEAARAAMHRDTIPLIPMDAVSAVLSGGRAVADDDCDRYVIPVFKGAEFLIQVKGDSMQPMYNSGDIVACKRLPLDTFFQWNRVYVIDSEQGVLIKRVRPGEDSGHIVLLSDNQNYTPFQLARRDIFSLSIVMGVIRVE